MTISLPDVLVVASVTSFVIGVLALILGLFLGARLARPRSPDPASGRQGGRALVELLHLLLEALAVVRELRDNQKELTQPTSKKKSRHK